MNFHKRKLTIISSKWPNCVVKWKRYVLREFLYDAKTSTAWARELQTRRHFLIAIQLVLVIIHNFPASLIISNDISETKDWKDGKISAQSHPIVKQICFPNGNVLFLSLFSLSKNWMHNVVWGCAEILPKRLYLTLKISIIIPPFLTRWSYHISSSTIVVLLFFPRHWPSFILVIGLAGCDSCQKRLLKQNINFCKLLFFCQNWKYTAPAVQLKL